MAFYSFGMIELLMVAVFGLGSSGLPLGIPPLPEDPLLAKIAPEDCTFYLSWSGMAKPDAASKNHTEQLLAEREIQGFLGQIERAISAGLLHEARDNEGRKVIATEAPKLAKALLTRPTAFYVGDIAAGANGPPEIEAGLIVATGDETARLMASVANLEAAMGGLNEVKMAGQSWKELPVPPGAPRVVWGFKGKYFIVGIGESAIENLVKRARGEAPKWLLAVRERCKTPRLANIAYLNVKKLTSLPDKVGAPPQVAMVIKALGLENVSHFASVTGLDESGFINRSHIALDGDPHGLLQVLDGKPLTAADLAPIPADATLAIAIRLDAGKVFRGIQEFVGTIEPRAKAEMDRGIEEMQSEVGIDLKNHVLGALGDTWRVYNSPGEGGLLATGLTAVVDVRDRASLAKALASFEEFAQKQAQRFAEPDDFGRVRRHATIKHFEHNKQTVYFVNFVGEESPVSPAWCLTEKELIISLFPSHVKSYLDRGSDFKSIATTPAVKALLEGGSPPTMLSYHDTRETFKVIYPVAQMLGNIAVSALQREGAEIDMSSFPSASAIARHLQPNTSTFAKAKDGFEITSRGTVPVAIGVWTAAPMFLFGLRTGGHAPGSIENGFEAAPDGIELPKGGGGDGIGAAPAKAVKLGRREDTSWFELAP